MAQGLAVTPPRKRGRSSLRLRSPTPNRVGVPIADTQFCAPTPRSQLVDNNDDGNVASGPGPLFPIDPSVPPPCPPPSPLGSPSSASTASSPRSCAWPHKKQAVAPPSPSLDVAFALADKRAEAATERARVGQRLHHHAYAHDAYLAPVMTYGERADLSSWIHEMGGIYDLPSSVAWLATNFFDRFVASGASGVHGNWPSALVGARLELISLSCLRLAASTCASTLLSDVPSFYCGVAHSLCGTSSRSGPRYVADLASVEAEVLTALDWRLHTETPHSHRVRQLKAVELSDGEDGGPPARLALGTIFGGDAFEIHLDYFSNLGDQHCLAWDFEPSTISAAEILAAVWRAKKLDAWGGDDGAEPELFHPALLATLGAACKGGEASLASCARRLHQYYLAHQTGVMTGGSGLFFTPSSCQSSCGDSDTDEAWLGSPSGSGASGSPLL